MPVGCSISASRLHSRFLLRFSFNHPFSVYVTRHIVGIAKVYIIFPGLHGKRSKNCNTCLTCQCDGRAGKGLGKPSFSFFKGEASKIVCLCMEIRILSATPAASWLPCAALKRRPKNTYTHEEQSKFVREASKGSHARGRRKQDE